MTTRILHRARALRPLQDVRPRFPNGSRTFSSSVPVLKKKRSAPYNENDMFSGIPEPDDLFGRNTAADKALNEHLESETDSSSNRRPFAEEFAEQLSFVTARVGPTASHSHPLVRQRALRRLLHVSQRKEDLEKVISLLTPWRDSGKVIDRDSALELIDRCLAWDPSLVLKIMSERSKNGFIIPNIADARRILHKLVSYRPPDVAQSTEREIKRQGNVDALKNAATFAALMPACGMKSAEDDLVCCALLAQACARNLLLSTIPTMDGKADPSHIPDAQASVAGLKDLARRLSATLSKPSQRLAKKLPLPSPEIISELSGAYREAGVKDPRAKLNPLVFQDRASGFTQTGVVERVWLLEAVKDVVKAAKMVDGVDVNANDLIVLERVVVGSQRADVDTFTLPKPWIFDERARKWALPAGLNVS